jgi:hypothetical protein
VRGMRGVIVEAAVRPVENDAFVSVDARWRGCDGPARGCRTEGSKETVDPADGFRSRGGMEAEMGCAPTFATVSS